MQNYPVGIELNPNYETCGEKTHGIDIDIADIVIDDVNAKKVGLNKYSCPRPRHQIASHEVEHKIVVCLEKGMMSVREI